MPASEDSDVAQLGHLLDALHCGALIINRSGQVVHANPRLCDLAQRAGAELVGQPLLTLYSAGAGRERIEEALRRFEEAREGEFFIPRPDGTRLPAIFSGRPLAGESPLSEYRVITVIDISALKAAEARVQEQYREITHLSDTILEQALDLKRHADCLERKVSERTADLHESNLDAIYMLAVASEAKDADTGAHVLRIRDYSRLIARHIGLSDAEAERIGYSAILHDVGKMQVPDQILKKPGPLSPEERAQMQEHTVVGERILSRKAFFEVARQIARSHHENWDGSGYPDGLSGEAIGRPARIVHLVDVWDGLISERVYKPAWQPEKALAFLREQSGRAFDPSLVTAFLALYESGLIHEISHVH